MEQVSFTINAHALIHAEDVTRQSIQLMNKLKKTSDCWRFASRTSAKLARQSSKPVADHGKKARQGVAALLTALLAMAKRLFGSAVLATTGTSTLVVPLKVA